GPGEQPDEEEKNVVLHGISHEDAEHQRVGHHQQGGVEKRPQKPQHRPAVARFELAQRQAPEQRAVLVKLTQVSDHPPFSYCKLLPMPSFAPRVSARYARRPRGERRFAEAVCSLSTSARSRRSSAESCA